ncbi:hypothetical protein [Laspinema olomoucense]|uniref:PIN domain-containing protein n=1 Tax=Laspinema olomoucense D3b TaxID=2953688 RepID=A0ABT2N7H9_9CYAN|nr:hypothetical protein [Laspinema sp. D3b]MCT7978436.1 hypothetical protein [Laspinema sp. D3b]
MIGIDTNILVRYLIQDDQQQWKQAAEFIKQNQPCFIANIVLFSDYLIGAIAPKFAV